MGNTNNEEPLIPLHGGYRKLHSFQLARLIYDITLRFCDTYISKRSRTHDPMAQAARSGVQNIAEGSLASGTSKKTELKLTNVARASLEELRLDYEDYLRQHALEIYPNNHPALMRYKALRCRTLLEFRRWVKSELQRIETTDTQGPAGTRKDNEKDKMSSELAANAALAVLNLCCYFLDKQLSVQADRFMREGGFTERMYNMRKSARKH